MSEPSLPMTFVDKGGIWVIAQFTLAVVFATVATEFPGAALLAEDAHIGHLMRSFAWGMVALGTYINMLAFREQGKDITFIPHPLPGTTLKTSNIYGRIRHPNYAGACLMLLGSALLHNSWNAIGMFGVLVVFLWNMAAKEEEILSLLPLMSYSEYKAAVVGRFLPIDFMLQRTTISQKATEGKQD